MQRQILRSAAYVLVPAAGPGVSLRGQPSDERLSTLGRRPLCVTEGTVTELPGKRLSVSVPKMRAYVTVPTSQDVATHFTYLGATGGEARLGSGEMRRQFGLKLHAEDACNLVYVMWRIEPESKLVVSVKSNPGQHTSAECGNRGYRNIKPRRGLAVPLVRPGDAHTLRAEMNGENLRVFVDGSLLWDGAVGREAVAFSGPVGMRSDNAGLELELQAGRSGSAPPPYPLACHVGESE